MADLDVFANADNVFERLRQHRRLLDDLEAAVVIVKAAPALATQNEQARREAVSLQADLDAARSRHAATLDAMNAEMAAATGTHTREREALAQILDQARAEYAGVQAEITAKKTERDELTREITALRARFA